MIMPLGRERTEKVVEISNEGQSKLLETTLGID